MKIGAFALLAFAACQPTEQTPASAVNVSAGRVERHANFPSKHVTARHIDVWLPDGYTPEKQYAVLYMHDGQMLFDSTTTWNRQEWGVDETVSALMKEGKIRDCLVVGVWNGGETRHIDYFPQKPWQLLPQGIRDSLAGLNRQKLGTGEQQKIFSSDVSSDAYLRFLVEELKPFIDSKYSTAKEASATFIAGSSMGGLISMYAICEYPQVFGGAACLSTHWIGVFDDKTPIPDKFKEYMEANLPDPDSHKIYFDLGTATLDAYYPPQQAKIDSVMRMKGYTDGNWQTRVFEGADHSEKAWRERLHIPITFLLGK